MTKQEKKQLGAIIADLRAKLDELQAAVENDDKTRAELDALDYQLFLKNQLAQDDAARRQEKTARFWEYIRCK